MRESLWKVLQKEMGISSLTKVQEVCIPAWTGTQDVVVQAPTGSGKTIAYLIPLIEILLSAKEKWKPTQIGAVIILPSRELAEQVLAVLKPLSKVSSLTSIAFIGGSKTAVDIQKFKKHGGNILVATPGRLEDLLNQQIDATFALKSYLKSVEILVLDEADRLLELGFQKSIGAILEQLPKQKRVGLFSATQVEGMDELIHMGLRNPIRIDVPSDGTVRVQSLEGSQNSQSELPSLLSNFYMKTRTDAKIVALIKVLKALGGKKVLLFLSSAACVDFFAKIVKSQLTIKGGILALHGKKRKSRAKILEKFRNMKTGLMISTDLMSRGIDVPDVDWVLQFDPPRRANWFLHRSGRSARCGKAGNALIFLAKSEVGYIPLLESKHNLKLQLFSLVQEPSEEEAENMREKLRNLSLSDREFLESGTRAFVSYVQAYSKHDCHIVCNLKELDLVGTAHSFGLLRLPKMPELRARDLGTFQRVEANTSDIKYTDKKKETARQVLLEARRNEAIEKKKQLGKEDAKPKVKQAAKVPRSVKRTKDIRDIDDDYKLIKKLKKGKISKATFDEAFE